MDKNTYCVIVAGGGGSRFWPLSSSATPKQFLDPLGCGKSFIRATYERFASFVAPQNILVATNIKYRDLVVEHIPELELSQILLEPVGRGTAPSIAYASHRIAKINPKAKIIITPADHHISGDSDFVHTMRDGLEFVEASDMMLTVGIKPLRAELGYGYIQFGALTHGQSIYSVKTFTEKPNLELAEAFVSSGEFLWNTGVIICSVGSMIDSLGEYLPDINSVFEKGRSCYMTDQEQTYIDDVYPLCENISIDYGVLERSSRVCVRMATFGWRDIGSWGSLFGRVEADENENIIRGSVLTYGTTDSVISISENQRAIIDGLQGFVVVSHRDRLLICPREHEKELSKWVNDAKLRFDN